MGTLRKGLGSTLLPGFRRINLLVGAAGIVVAWVFLRWSARAGKAPTDWAWAEALVWGILAAVQVLPALGIPFALLPAPRQGRRAWAFWRMWLVASIGELVVVIALIAYVWP